MDKDSSDILESGFPISLEQVGYLKILVYGDTGTGKTSLGATMPGKTAVLAGETHGGLALRLLALEVGKDPLQDFKRFRIGDHGEKQTQQSLIPSVDYMYRVIDRLERGDHPYASLLFDSLTDFMFLLVRSKKNQKGGLEKQLTNPEWNHVIDETRNLCCRLRDLQMHVCVVALQTQVQDDTNRLYWRPSLAGKQLPSDVGQYFNIVGRAIKERPRGDRNRAKFSINTEGGDEAYTKGIRALLPDEEPNIASWVEKISSYGVKNGVGEVPLVPGVTVRTAPPEQREIRMLLEDPQIRALFDKLGWLDAKRIACCQKYPSKDALMPKLDAHVRDMPADPKVSRPRNHHPKQART